MAVLTDVASVARLSCQSETKPTIRLQTISQSAAAVPFHAGIHLCLKRLALTCAWTCLEALRLILRCASRHLFALPQWQPLC